MQHSFKRFLPLLLVGVLLLALPLAASGSDHQHKFGEWSVQRKATCTTDGVEFRQCTICGETEVRTVNPLGHDWADWIPQATASCTQEGKDTRTCKRDPSHVETRTFAMLPHNYTPYRPVVPATCETEGESVRNCTTCNTVNETIKTGKLGHNWGPYQPSKAATCTEKGQQIRYCMRDNSHTETIDIPALGHNWGPYQATKTATCTEKGVQTRYCLNDAKHTETIDVPALGHNWGSWKTESNPTCSKDGSAKRICSRDATHTETQVLKALGPNQTSGHRFGQWLTTKEARCDYTGVQERKCPDCGRVEKRDIAKTKHTSDGKWVTKREPTLQQRGLRVTTCSVCGQQASSETFGHRAIKYEMRSHGFGPLTNLANSAIAGQDKLIYIDMTQPGVKRFPLVTEDSYYIADVVVTVGAGTLQVKLEKLNNASVLRYRTWHFFNSPEEVTRQKIESDSLPFEQSIAVPGDHTIIHVWTLANYSQSHRENIAFSEAMMSPDGVNSYADQAKLMLEQITGGENP